MLTTLVPDPHSAQLQSLHGISHLTPPMREPLFDSRHLGEIHQHRNGGLSSSGLTGALGLSLRLFARQSGLCNAHRDQGLRNCHHLVQDGCDRRADEWRDDEWRSAVAVPTRNDATTGYRFAVTRWRSEVNSNCRYRFLNCQTTASC
jgi:hypothetical protein